MLLRLRQWHTRLLHWEYWSFHFIYGPIYFYWFWLCIKSRSFFFFNASNPGITNGGFLMESKKEIYDLLPPALYPATWLVKPGEEIDLILGYAKALGYPLISKPDIGLRGIGVHLLHTEDDVINNHRVARVDYLLQQYIPFEEEAGIFYYRFPGQKNGVVSGVVYKEFLAVCGNGASTIKELLLAQKRHTLQIDQLTLLLGKQLDFILPAGEKKVLVPFGNHCRGARFIDYSDHINEDLRKTMDTISAQIKGFYFGRLDVKYDNWDDLCKGKNFSIIEVNGAGSEPAHIYDSKHSIWFGWREIIRHWKIMYEISAANKRDKNIAYMSTRQGLQMLRANSRYLKMIG